MKLGGSGVVNPNTYGGKALAGTATESAAKRPEKKRLIAG